ncbi:MAG: DUF2490 domain-containing protein [Bacteroidales bacterium]|nr:DUF2490 domain-containing protein [Bacteroidales bacterium]
MFRLLLLILLLFSVSVIAQQREMDGGACLAVEVKKGITRNLDLSVEEEVRLITNNTGFNRSMTTLGADYSLFNRRMKVGLYYCYMYVYNSDFYYESRHRVYLSLSYKQPLGNFILSWRGRLQRTYRNENKGEYKVNPKYILKNKLELEYHILGSRWRPFLSCDLSNTINDPIVNEIYRARFQGGTNYRLSRATSLDLFLRFDEYFSGKDPRVFSIGVAYKVKL